MFKLTMKTQNDVIDKKAIKRGDKKDASNLGTGSLRYFLFVKFYFASVALYWLGYLSLA